MFCITCSKLVILQSNKICLNCQGIVNNNISVLCEFCSNSEKICSVCLKRVNNSAVDKFKNAGCFSCRAKNR